MTNEQVLEDINKICKIYESVLVVQKTVNQAEEEIKAIKDKYKTYDCCIRCTKPDVISHKICECWRTHN